MGGASPVPEPTLEDEQQGGTVAHLTAVVGALSVATSCFFSTDSETGRVVGIISSGGPGQPVIEAPDTVRLGIAFAATVNSFGSSSCTTPDGVKLTLEAAQARVIPFDRVPDSDEVACTADITAIPHPVELRFTEPGTATIVADGIVYGTNFERVRGTVSKTVVVVP
jgi:hypothetical protein